MFYYKHTILFSELIDFKARRVSTFNKNLLELAELEIRHAQVLIIINKIYLVYFSLCKIIYKYNTNY